MIMNKNLEIKLSTTQNQVEFLENIFNKYETQEKSFLNFLNNDSSLNIIDKMSYENYDKQLGEIVSDHFFGRPEYQILYKFIEEEREKNNNFLFISLPKKIKPQIDDILDLDNIFIQFVKHLLPPNILLRKYKKTKQEANDFLDWYKEVVYETICYFQPLLIARRGKDNHHNHIEFDKFCEEFSRYLQWKAFFHLRLEKIVSNLKEEKKGVILIHITKT